MYFCWLSALVMNFEIHIALIKMLKRIDNNTLSKYHHKSIVENDRRQIDIKWSLRIVENDVIVSFLLLNAEQCVSV